MPGWLPHRARAGRKAQLVASGLLRQWLQAARSLAGKPVGKPMRPAAASHLTMPAVTLFCRCSGLPSATTHSPTRRLAERPADQRNLAGGVSVRDQSTL